MSRPPGVESCASTGPSERSDDATAASSDDSRSRAAASCARSSDSPARCLTAAASRLTTIPAIRKTPSAATFRESEIVRWWRGSMKKKLSVSTEATAVASAAISP